MATGYIETSVPSYYVARPTDSLIQSARQQATRQWWDNGCSGLDLATSLETLDEAGRGDPKMAGARLELLDSIAVLSVTDIAVELAENLVKNQFVAERYSSDAIHIAGCAAHAVDYLITWNYKHIANPFLRDRIRKEVETLGLHMPVMCSPRKCSKPMQTTETSQAATDEVITEVWRTKREIAEEHGCCVKALALDLQRRQQAHPRLVSPKTDGSEQVVDQMPGMRQGRSREPSFFGGGHDGTGSL